MSGDDLLAKADRALASAATLLHEGDTEGACNRAYYAMFNAARAALLAVDAPAEAVTGKSHSGLHAAFNLYLVKAGRLGQAYGADFRRAEKLRHVSDYVDQPVGFDTAKDIVERAQEFVNMIKRIAVKP